MSERPIELHLSAPVSDSNFTQVLHDFMSSCIDLSVRLSEGSGGKTGRHELEVADRIDEYDTRTVGFDPADPASVLAVGPAPYSVSLVSSTVRAHTPLDARIVRQPHATVGSDGSVALSPSGWATLQVTTARRVLDENPDVVIDFLKEKFQVYGCSFGCITDDISSFRTAFELATKWKTSRSLPLSAEFLRGYAWVTAIGKSHVDRLLAHGVSIEEFEKNSIETSLLEDGSVVLRAAQSLADYDTHAMDQLERLLHSVLLPGLTRPLFKGYEHLRVVYGRDTSSNSVA